MTRLIPMSELNPTERAEKIANFANQHPSYLFNVKGLAGIISWEMQQVIIGEMERCIQAVEDYFKNPKFSEETKKEIIALIRTR